MGEGTRSQRLLLVDDDPLVLRATARMLEREFEVVAANGAEEALRFVATECFDVVLTDYHMPGMNGIALLERIRTERPAVRRVLVSGRFEEIDPPVGLLLSFFRKPIHPEDLRRVLLSNDARGCDRPGSTGGPTESIHRGA